ncbi:flagellar basal body P-ring formation chaperone FlgA [Thermodesulfatator indicus]|nr:flagellar basal body P-ring formation chaperone FlgA [Thermodesulfatator indicus]
MRKVLPVIILTFFFMTPNLWAKTYDQAFFHKLFLKEVSERLTWVKGEIKLERLIVEPERVELPDGTSSVVRLKGRPKLGLNTMLVDFYRKERVIARVRVMGFVEAYVPVLVAKRPLGRHEVIDAVDVALEKRPVSRLPQDALTSLADALGKRLKVSVRPGQVIRAYALEVPPVVKRGKIVRIVAKGPNFTVTALGEARQDGCPGEIIRVRNLSSKREIFAQVVDAGTVEVKF